MLLFSLTLLQSLSCIIQLKIAQTEEKSMCKTGLDTYPYSLHQRKQFANFEKIQPLQTTNESEMAVAMQLPLEITFVLL